MSVQRGTPSTPTTPITWALGLVARVSEESAEVLVTTDERRRVDFAPVFPRPRAERVSPGHLVAVARRGEGPERIVWRWYDALVLAVEPAGVRLWEPGHGEVLATPRPTWAGDTGSRAWASAGLPGADWWVGGPAVPPWHGASVELDAVDALYREHGLWDAALPEPPDAVGPD